MLLFGCLSTRIPEMLQPVTERGDWKCYPPLRANKITYKNVYSQTGLPPKISQINQVDPEQLVTSNSETFLGYLAAPERPRVE